MKTRFVVCGVVGLGLISPLLFGRPQALLRKIESPETVLEGERKHWVGQEIYFLPRRKTEAQGEYIGFCRDPRNPRSSAVAYDVLAGKRARILEVWLGNVAIVAGGGRLEEERVFFWKMQMRETGRALWYWDNGSTSLLGVGFVRDYEEASRLVGDSLWVKNMYVLYTLHDDDVVRLQNLQKVVLEEVRWGEAANYPLQFVLRTDDGRVGYRHGKNLGTFLDFWHRVDPREAYKAWDAIYWEAIENRRLTTGMVPTMVEMSWGNPIARDSVVTVQGTRVMLWVYPGVSRSVYGVFFVGGKLVYWQLKLRREAEEEVIQYSLREGLMDVSCDVRIDWRKMVEEGVDFVTFSWQLRRY